MEHDIVLNKLQKRNNFLKSRLIHEQLKSGNYLSEHFKKYQFEVLNEYKTHKSFFKVASIVGLTQKEIMDWYIQGQCGNPKFRGFFLAINDINDGNAREVEVEPAGVSDPQQCSDGEYMISQYGDGWSYKTYVNGEKIFIISDELENLKRKVKDRHLPLD
jgi:hypothetical protein